LGIVGEEQVGDLHSPSEAIEDPERRKSSEPIWIEKTLSGGKVQAGDLPALGGVVVLESPAMVEVEVEMEDERMTGG
jgi:hypothetical protein